MKHFILLAFTFAISLSIFSQSGFQNRCPYKGMQLTDSRTISQAADFTITTTDGITRNLYNTLDSGKTVFVDLFYTTCSWCQIYAPVIEEIYQNTGAGLEDIVFWGISNNLDDPDPVIDQYKINFDITNPCAGPNGGGTAAHTIVISGQNFYGWPTYCVICPDRTLYFDPVYPPTVDGFNPYFSQCAATVGFEDEIQPSDESGILSAFPNPASNSLSLEIKSSVACQANIECYNLLGIKVSSVSFELKPGVQTFMIPVDLLPPGTYFLKMIRDKQFLDSHKVMITRH